MTTAAPQDKNEDSTDTAALSAEEHGFILSDDFVLDIAAKLDAEQLDEAEELCAELHAADMADLFEKLGAERRALLIKLLGPRLDPETFAHLEPGVCASIMEGMEASQIASIVNELESDDALHLIEDFDEDRQREIMRALSAKARAVVEEGLTFPEDSAGRLMRRELVAIPQFWTVGKTLDYLRVAGDALPEDFHDIFVVDPMHHIIGEIPLSKVLRAKRAEKIEALAHDALHIVPANMDQEDVAFLFRKDALTSAPVVDESQRLIGVITIDDVVAVIDEEAEEDILKMAGVETGDIYRAVAGTVKSRFSWLAVNLVTAIAASIVIALFEATIKEIVALAILMPIVASMGGNAGTQTLTVAVRALATKELSSANAWRITAKELLVGMINGIFFALIMGALTWLWFDSQQLGLVIAAAMVVNLIVAGLAGVSIPLGLTRLGLDPAVSSSVFVTTITDMLGFFAFLGLAAALLL